MWRMVPVAEASTVCWTSMHRPGSHAACPAGWAFEIGLLPQHPSPPCSSSAGKHYDARLDAQQRKLQDMAAEQEEWEQK